MLQKIIDIVAESAGDFIIPNPGIPNEKNDQAIQAAGTVVGEEIIGILKSGNVSNILSMFQRFMSDESNSTLLTNVIGRYAGILSSKFNINEDNASEISSKVIPEALSHLVRRVVDPKDERLSLQDFSSYVLNEAPQLRSLVQMVSESAETTGGNTLKDIAASALGGNQDVLESVLAGLTGRK